MRPITQPCGELNRRRLITAKIAEFGTTKYELSGKMQTYAGSSVYMAPEFWEQELAYTNVGDMWSFGVIAVELLTDWEGRLDEWDPRLPPTKAQYQEWINRLLRPRVVVAPERFRPLLLGLLKLFMLPAHTSHFLQPLDVVVCQPLKHFHAKAVDDATRKGCATFDKVDFLHAIKDIRKNTFKRNTILSAFRLTGLVPFNPSIVLHKIEESQPPAAFQPQSGRFQTPSEDEFDDPETPTTTQGLEKLSLRLKAAEEGSPSRRKAIQEKFIKGALIQSKAGAALKNTLKENTAYGEARRLRHQRT